MGDQREVEAAVDNLPGLDVRAGEAVHLGERVLELGELIVGESGDANAEAERLGDDACGVELLEVVDGELRDSCPAVELGLDQSLALQEAQGLAHGSAADAELLGDLYLREPRARCDVAAQDVFAESVVDDD